MLCLALAVIEAEIAGMEPPHGARRVLLAGGVSRCVRISGLVDASIGRSAAVVGCLVCRRTASSMLPAKGAVVAGGAETMEVGAVAARTWCCPAGWRSTALASWGPSSATSAAPPALQTAPMTGRWIPAVVLFLVMGATVTEIADTVRRLDVAAPLGASLTGSGDRRTPILDAPSGCTAGGGDALAC